MIAERAAPGQDQVRMILSALDQQGGSGANWFYWVAGLSVVNTFLAMSAAKRHFVLGLGLTQVVDAFAHHFANQYPGQETLLRGVALGFDALVVLAVCLFGWLSKRRYVWIFGLGMFLYLLDGLLFILFEDWLSLAFHVYVLFCMWKGLGAYRQLNTILKSAGSA